MSEKKKKKLLTLSEISKRAAISMPTLQRYKKLYQHRIPSEGTGRRQRYPEEAIAVFKQLKEENLAQRGRSRTQRGQNGEPLLTLSAICEQTKISYPTLQRYVRLFGDRIPHQGSGRKRRYLPEAVDVFLRLRKESPRGRRKASDESAAGADGTVLRRLARLERAQAEVQKELRELTRLVKRPMTITLKR